MCNSKSLCERIRKNNVPTIKYRQVCDNRGIVMHSPLDPTATWSVVIMCSKQARCSKVLSLSLSLSLYLLLTQEWVPLALVDNVQEPHLIAAIFPGIQK